MTRIIDEFEDTIVNLDVEKVCDISKKLVKFSKVSRNEILKAIEMALDTVGQKYERGEYFLSELIMAGEVIKEVLKIIEPKFKKDKQETVATIVMATVKGDLHDIGKNITSMLLQFSDFKVVDLGTDVSAEEIVKAVKKNNAEILGLSTLLSTTVHEFGSVTKELEKTNIRNKVKVIVGGTAVNEEVAEKYGADAWGATAIDGLKKCKQWYSKRDG